jgi:hypothetical protein
VTKTLEDSNKQDYSTETKCDFPSKLNQIIGAVILQIAMIGKTLRIGDTVSN